MQRKGNRFKEKIISRLEKAAGKGRVERGDAGKEKTKRKVKR